MYIFTAARVVVEFIKKQLRILCVQFLGNIINRTILVGVYGTYHIFPNILKVKIF